MDSLYNLILVSSIWSNYTVTNKSNFYNFVISILIKQTPSQQVETITDLKMTMGLRVYNSFMEYVKRKFHYDHELVRLVSR